MNFAGKIRSCVFGAVQKLATGVSVANSQQATTTTRLFTIQSSLLLSTEVAGHREFTNVNNRSLRLGFSITVKARSDGLRKKQ